MKAAVIAAYGAPAVLQYRDVADPRPGAGEVLVRTVAAGVNPVDGMIRAGLTKAYMPVQFPGILGWDVSGTVETVGEGVSNLAPGDRVMGWTRQTYAELVAVAADLLVKIPDALETQSAAALPLPAVTGSQLISVGAALKADETVLVSGAVGAVGRAAVFTAKDRGARVIAAVRNKHVTAAADIGADDVVDLDDPDALGRLGPLDVVANTIHGANASRLLLALRNGGRFVSATGAPDNAAERSDVAVTAFVSKQDRGTLEYIAQGAAKGRFNVPIGLRLPLAEAGQAHRALEQGGAGKIILLA